MPIYSYHHIHINVSDIVTSVNYFKSMFNATEISRVESMPGRWTSTLDISGTMFYLSDKLYPMDADELPGNPNPHMGLEHFGLGVDDFHAAIADLRAKGAEFLMEPHEFKPGAWIAFILAPDSVRIELLGS